MAKAKAARRTLDSYTVKNINKTVRREFLRCSSFSNLIPAISAPSIVSVYMLCLLELMLGEFLIIIFVGLCFGFLVCCSWRLRSDPTVGLVKAVVRGAR